MTPLFVTGVGLVAPGLPDWPAAITVLTGAAPWECRNAELPIPAILPKNERRRSSPAIRLALEAAHQAITASGLPAAETPTIFGCSGGDGHVVNTLLETVTGAEPRVSPTLFHNSVHNAPAGYWCIATGSREPSLSIGAYDSTVAATLFTAAIQARRRPVLACIYDAPLPEPLHSLRPLGPPFGAALVLSADPQPTAIGRLSIQLGDRKLAPTKPQTSCLIPLFDRNPAARLLPVLEALARHQACRVVLSWDDTPPLTVDIGPC